MLRRFVLLRRILWAMDRNAGWVVPLAVTLACVIVIVVLYKRSHKTQQSTYYQWQNKEAARSTLQYLIYRYEDDAVIDFEHAEPNELVQSIESKINQLELRKREIDANLRKFPYAPSFSFPPRPDAEAIRQAHIVEEARLRNALELNDLELESLGWAHEEVLEAVVEVPSNRAVPQASVKRGLF
jgi:hypothetical protein